MKFDEVIIQLEKFGNEQTKKTYCNHGAKEPLFGVKVGDLKKIVKNIKKDHELALQLYNTGNSDAMYLAGLIADEALVTKAQLNKWAMEANWYMISEYTVAWIAAESKYGWELSLEWIRSEKENIASSGWATLSNLVSILPDQNLDINKLNELLTFIEANIHSSQNRVRYVMNGFVIAVGSYVEELSEKSIDIASKIGKVQVNVGKTSCKVPFAPEYIKKVLTRNNGYKKRKAARC